MKWRNKSARFFSVTNKKFTEWGQRGFLQFEFSPLNILKEYFESTNRIHREQQLPGSRNEVLFKRLKYKGGYGETETNMETKLKNVLVHTNNSRRTTYDGFIIFNTMRRSLWKIGWSWIVVFEGSVWEKYECPNTFAWRKSRHWLFWTSC